MHTTGYTLLILADRVTSKYTKNTLDLIIYKQQVILAFNCLWRDFEVFNKLRNDNQVVAEAESLCRLRKPFTLKSQSTVSDAH